jgi:two-component system, chemotaxis family, sensor kinase CheA
LQNDRRKQRERRRTEVNFGRRKSDLAGDIESPKEATSIRVAIDKLDAVVDLVGELIINQSMVNREYSSLNMVFPEKLRNTLEIQNRLTRSLQDHAMNIRMLPIDFAFQRLPRLVHDLCESLGKKVVLNITGKETELDKTVLEKMSDPLVHLVRNSLDHGMEKPDERLKAGKPETGTINVSAYHKGGNIIITISDDGAGLNIEKIRSKAIEKELISPEEDLTEQQIINIIFLPGFSTATEVNDVSGRGVGMDVVNSNIKLLGGAIDVTSKQGDGCTITIRLPLTMAILDGQLIRVGSHIYIISLLPIIESVQIKPELLNNITGKSDVYHYRDEYIPVLNLKKFLAGINENILYEDLLVVVESGNTKVGLLVDEVIGQQQVVIKSLEQNYQNMTGIAGASILGDGSVALILDVPGLVYNFLQTVH